ncbi:hypothetical protein VTJ49DRAFT_1401 [Mycothermus thermophilus]|uniref:Uncharacterized protein n=1 Tax=Humicola insolens TaxID=85995 RepID=A0ABR3VE60_HUMIN
MSHITQTTGSLSRAGKATDSSPQPNMAPHPQSEWRAVMINEAITYSNPRFPDVITDDKERHTVNLMFGEVGYSMATKIINGIKHHRVQLTRYGIHFYVEVPEDHLTIGEKFRSPDEKIAELQALMKASELPDAVKHWKDQGTPLVRYIKCLWLAIREQRPKLQIMGIPTYFADQMFKLDSMMRNVDRICAHLHPQFRQAMEQPNQNLGGLITHCVRQTTTSPPDGCGSIYLRLYPTVEQPAALVDQAYLYTGWTPRPQGRHFEHTQCTISRPYRNTGRPSHYDLARRVPASRWQIRFAVLKSVEETKWVFDSLVFRLMLEQTIILMTKSYAGWTRNSSIVDLYVQRARFLQQIEKKGNSLGIRLEWKHHSQEEWSTAPVQIGIKRHRQICAELLEGNNSKLLDVFQEVAAIINMVRGEKLRDPPEGFWHSLGRTWTRPAPQLLVYDHLKQTIRWETQPETLGNVPRPAVFMHNLAWLCTFRGCFSPETAIGDRPAYNDGLWFIDNRSTRSAVTTKARGTGQVRCDTCIIIASRKGRKSNVTWFKCEHDPITKACPPCAAMHRQCTFTPATSLLSGWIGREVDYHEQLQTNANQTSILFPVYGGGPMRHLIPHLGIEEKECITPVKIPEPFGWETLYPGGDEEVDEDGAYTPSEPEDEYAEDE